MNDLAGTIRTEPEAQPPLDPADGLRARPRPRSVAGTRRYNPGWHLALDLPHLLLVSECIARAALEREESRGGHTRDDFPAPDPEWGRTNLVCTWTADGRVGVTRQPLPQMPPELAEVFEEAP